MRQYQDLVRLILETGHDVPDRTGTGTRAIFGHQMRFDLRKGFPLVTTKRTYWHGAFVEMLWFLRGDTNTEWLNEHGVSIWNEWATKDGDLGPIYGDQWVEWEGIRGVNQIAALIEGLRHDPHSRRHVLTAWTPVDLPIPSVPPHEQPLHGHMALAPCHCLVQFHVDGWKQLHCQLYQRSADVFLGVPFNIAGYALLTHLLAHHLGFGVGEFIHTLGDAHLYSNHFEQAKELLTRDPRPLPELSMAHAPDTPLNAIEPADIGVTGYGPQPAIKAQVAI